MNHNNLRYRRIYPGIMSAARGDVNGDGILENVYLTGKKKPDSPFTQDITLVIQDGKSKEFTRISLPDNIGYHPRLYLVEFTGDGILDILVSIDTGGSGGTMYHYIYSFVDNIPKLLFDFNVYNESLSYEVSYLDDYRVEVKSLINDKKYLIDITNRGEEYINEIYYSDGRLKNPIEGFVNPLSGLYPVDFDSNNVYELLAYQKIAGRYNADSLGYVMNTLKWEGNEFVLDNQYIAIF